MPQRAVIYARFSSSKQREESIEGQLRICKEFAKEHNLVILGEYCDRGISGRTDKRPELQRMLNDSESRLFDFVLLWKGDRIARNRDDKAFIRRQLRNNGVSILSVMEKVPTSPEGIILQSVLDGMDEYYSANLASNVTRGMKENVLHGRYNGSTVPLGYIIDENKRWQKHPEHAELIPILYQMNLDGYSHMDLVELIKSHGIKVNNGNEYTVQNIYRLLRNKKYIGIYEFGGTINTDAIPPLVSEELFNAVQSNLQTYKKRRTGVTKHSDSTYHYFPLSGKLNCGKCHDTYIGDSGTSKNGNMYYYYTCINKKRSKYRCQSKSYPQHDLEDFVFNSVNKLVLAPDTIDMLSKALMKHQKSFDSFSALNILKNREKDVSRGIDNLLNLAMTMTDSTSLSNKLRELEKELDKIKLGIQREKLSASHLTADQVNFWLQSFAAGKTKHEETQQLIIATFLNNVIIHDDHVDMVFNFCRNENKVTFIEERDLIPIAECSSKKQLVTPVYHHSNTYLYHNCFVFRFNAAA